MFYISSTSTNSWYGTKAKTLMGAKATASRVFCSREWQILTVGKSSVCGIQCVSKKIGNQWIDLK